MFVGVNASVPSLFFLIGSGLNGTSYMACNNSKQRWVPLFYILFSVHRGRCTSKFPCEQPHLFGVFSHIMAITFAPNCWRCEQKNKPIRRTMLPVGWHSLTTKGSVGLSPTLLALGSFEFIRCRLCFSRHQVERIHNIPI